MSATPTRRRAGWPWLLLIAGLVVIVVVGGRPSDPTPFDPTSTDPTGTRALVLLLEELGADVTVTDRVPVDDLDEPTIAVLRDRAQLDEQQAVDLDAALTAGATVVVTDPFSALTPPLAMLVSALFEGKTWGVFALGGVALVLAGQALLLRARKA